MPPVRRYLVSTALASVGHNILVTVLFKQVFDITGDELDIGLIGLAQFVPAVLADPRVGLGGRPVRSAPGHVAVPVRARRCVRSRSCSTAGGSRASVWPLFAIAFVLGASDAMMMPARRSIPPLICSPDEFPQVIALWTATFTGSSIVGPGARWVPVLDRPVDGVRHRRRARAALDHPDAGRRLRAPARAGHGSPDPQRRARGPAGSSVARRSCWPRSRSTCSRCCSVVRSR